MTSIAANDDAEDDDDDGLPIAQKRSSYTAPKSILKDVIKQVNVKLHEKNRFSTSRRHLINIFIFYSICYRVKKMK